MIGRKNIAVKLTDDDKRELAAGDAWREFGERFGWVLHGWSGDAVATFSFKDDSQRVFSGDFEVHKQMRLDIERVLSNIGGER